MIVAIVTHLIRSGMLESAKRRIDANGERMAPMPGFLFRHALVSFDDPQKLVTVTAWESSEHHQDWCRQQADTTRSEPASVEETPYIRVETELFSVQRSHNSLRLDR